MKFKTSKKAIKEGYYRIIGIGYCDLQYLLKGENAVAYSSGNDGWACDYYDINGVCISTGYGYINNKNVNVLDYHAIRQYDMRAENLWHDSKDNYYEKVEKVHQLLVEMVRESTKGTYDTFTEDEKATQ